MSELDSAALYYGSIDDDLGERFAIATEVAIAQIHTSPLQARKFDGQVRKVRAKRFPYAVLYWVGENQLNVVSVMHLHREPGYWRHRL